MVAINWNILNQRQDPGQAFHQGVQQGQVMRKQRELDGALQGLARNPNDPNALNALLPLAPQMAIPMIQQQQKTQTEDRERKLKVIGNAARMATDPQKWDGIIDHLVANGMPEAAQYKGKFSPEMRAAIMAEAGVKDEGSQEYTLAPGAVRMRGNEVVAQSPFRPERITDPATGQVFEFGGGAPAAAPTTEAEYNTLPPGATYTAPDGSTRVKGGAGQAGPQTFP